MKKIVNILIALTVVAGLASCEDFFTREPIEELPSSTYFETESDMQYYTNGMLNSWMPNPTDGTLAGDAYNDLIATKTSTDFFRADVEWDNVKQGGWSWTFLRRCNYMINNMPRGKENVSEEVYNHYMGVARFWRAYHYFSRIKTFSDVVWTDKVIDPTDTEALMSTRIDREDAFEKVKEDLIFACANVSADSKFHTDSRNQIDQYVVNAIASRIFLYEGTFRKNVKVNPATNQPWQNTYDTPESLITLAAEKAKFVIDSKKFKLAADYKSLFKSAVLDKDEVIWGRTYIADVTGRHGYSLYFNSSTNGQQYSGTKDLVRHFLKADGTPVANGHQTVKDEFTGRDPRLAVTVLGPGYKIETSKGEANQDPDFTNVFTGYMLVKWVIPIQDHFNNSLDENSIPLVRYPEVLLNYAEAMNELGQMTADIWSSTVGAIRTRAGVKDLGLPTVADPYLADYYSRDLKHKPNLDPVALEIRRERVTELTFEGELRQADIYRYGQADLVARRYNGNGWAGLYLTKADVENGFKFNEGGKTYKISSAEKSTTATAYTIQGTNNSCWSLETEGDGYYLVYNYKLKWEDRMYCRPIPQGEIMLNEALGQNYGW